VVRERVGERALQDLDQPELVVRRYLRGYARLCACVRARARGAHGGEVVREQFDGGVDEQHGERRAPDEQAAQ
jgi:hypothetical protein